MDIPEDYVVNVLIAGFTDGKKGCCGDMDNQVQALANFLAIRAKAVPTNIQN